VLRSADFTAFFTARAEALLALIEDAMGKPAIRVEIAQHDADEDAPEFFDAEPPEAGTDVAYQNENVD
jgi:hypothetical protein